MTPVASPEQFLREFAEEMKKPFYLGDQPTYEPIIRAYAKLLKLREQGARLDELNRVGIYMVDDGVGLRCKADEGFLITRASRIAQLTTPNNNNNSPEEET